MNTIRQMLRKWWRVEWAMTKAFWRAAITPGARRYVESTWRGTVKPPLPQMIEYISEDDEPVWREEVTFVSVARGTRGADDFRLVYIYYGTPAVPFQFE